MNKMSLYDLSDHYLRALEAFTDPELDFPPEAIADTLEALEGELQDKAINVTKFMKNMESAAAAIKAAEAQMAKRRKALETRVQGLKAYLKTNMEASGIMKIDSPWFRLAVQNNPPAVEIFNAEAIPAAFKQETVTVKIDKNAIKAAINAGEIVPGAGLLKGTRLVVR